MYTPKIQKVSNIQNEQLQKSTKHGPDISFSAFIVQLKYSVHGIYEDESKKFMKFSILYHRKRGNIQERKLYNLSRKPLKKFMKEYYLSVLKKVCILSTSCYFTKNM